MTNLKKRLWIDADACPKPIKEIIFRAALRTQTTVILVSNQWISTPISPFIQKVQVSQGFDKADAYILEHMQSAELVITADIPLAAQVIDKNGYALNPRGELYTHANVKQQLAMRNLHTELRGAGLIIGGPAKINPQQVQAFANHLDQWLTRNKS